MKSVSITLPTIGIVGKAKKDSHLSLKVWWLKVLTWSEKKNSYSEEKKKGRFYASWDVPNLKIFCNMLSLPISPPHSPQLTADLKASSLMPRQQPYCIFQPPTFRSLLIGLWVLDLGWVLMCNVCGCGRWCYGCGGSFGLWIVVVVWFFGCLCGVWCSGVFFFFFGFKILNYLLLKYHCFQLNYFIRLMLIFQIPQSSTIELLKKKKKTLWLYFYFQIF